MDFLKNKTVISKLLIEITRVSIRYSILKNFINLASTSVTSCKHVAVRRAGRRAGAGSRHWPPPSPLPQSHAHASTYAHVQTD